MADAPTLLEVIRSIGWLSDSDAVDFDSVDWSTLDSDKRIRLEGYTDDGDWVVYLTLRVETCDAYPHHEEDFHQDDDDEDGRDE